MPVYHPDEINEIFDRISYLKVIKYYGICILSQDEKMSRLRSLILRIFGTCTLQDYSVTLLRAFQGSSVIRMMNFFLGDGTFQRGLTVSNTGNWESLLLWELCLLLI